MDGILLLQANTAKELAAFANSSEYRAIVNGTENSFLAIMKRVM